MVEHICRYLKDEGHQVVVLTRGYKRKNADCRFPDASYENMGDEPYMLAKKLGDIPVVVDADRVRGAKMAIADYGADTVILDDGYQQWRIKKDLEVVTIDAVLGFGNRYIIPRGILREPLSALKRADIFVLTKVNLSSRVSEIKDLLARVNPAAAVFESIHEPTSLSSLGEEKLFSCDILRGKTVTLLSGIGDPISFEESVLSLGAKIGLSFRFSDHYAYSQGEWEKIIRESQAKHIDTIITTEKDAVRLEHLRLTPCALRLLILHIKLKILKNEDALRSRLLQLYYF